MGLAAFNRMRRAQVENTVQDEAVKQEVENKTVEETKDYLDITEDTFLKQAEGGALKRKVRKTKD